MYVYRTNNKKGKVHLFKSHVMHTINNPDMTGPEQQWGHVINIQCPQKPFRFVYAGYKIRDFFKEFVITDIYPDDRELCGSCRQLLNSDEELNYPPEDVDLVDGWYLVQTGPTKLVSIVDIFPKAAL